MNGATREPVASQYMSDSAISSAEAAKSPAHVVAVPSAASRIGSLSSAPASRAARTWRVSEACQGS
jgi:hypothetical protein